VIFNEDIMWLVRGPHYAKFKNLLNRYEPSIKLFDFYRYRVRMYTFHCKFHEIQSIIIRLNNMDIKHEVWFVQKLSSSKEFTTSFMEACRDKSAENVYLKIKTR
jgi:hypothetical protein